MIIGAHALPAPRALMNWRLSSRLTAGLAAALVWALAAGSALFWALQAGGGRTLNAPVAGGPPPGAVAVDTRTVARMLGAPEPTAAAPAPDVVSRLALRGIVTHGSRGAALIAVDGKPARPVRVGAALEGLEGGWTLHAVEPRAVVLAADGRQARLEMPKLSERSSARDAVAPARPVPPAVPGAPLSLPPPGAPPPVVR